MRIAALLVALVGLIQGEAPKAARSVHLWWKAPPSTAVYREVVVERSAPGSYFMACGFNGGYFGIQEHADGKKVALFSVWDTYKGDDAQSIPEDQRVKVLGSGKDVLVKRFGGEGTGAQSILPFEWKVGQPVQFFLRSWATEGKTTTFAAYIRNPVGGGWLHMATFQRRDPTGTIAGHYSFIEDFRRDTKSATETRRALFGHAWFKTVEGTWTQAPSVRFTASGAEWEAKDTIDAGVSGQDFYLQTGGDTKMSFPLKSDIAAPGVAMIPTALPTPVPHTFEARDDGFLLDGKPFQIVCGEMHFARIPPEYWRHRLRMARAMGLNTVATYVFWNIQEPEQGQFDFTGPADVAQFVKIAQEEGLFVLLRPGPYACAEWEFGGYPYWLLKDRDLKVRSRDPEFLAASREYLLHLGQQLAPLQVTKGGPILMVQAENEYGSYGDDHAFVQANADYVREAGFDVPLYTADGGSLLSRGAIDAAVPAVNGDAAIDTLAAVKAFRGHGPYMCGELYPGWLDHWGERFVRVGAKGVAREVDDYLGRGISLSLYMFHGGTNFGFYNGANTPYAPSITSYDYDAPLTEAGHVTPKYRLLRDTIAKHLPAGALPPIPEENPVIAIPELTLTEHCALSAALPAPVKSDAPLSMEDLGQAYGYVLYRAKITKPLHGELKIEHGIRDWARITIDGQLAGILDRRTEKPAPLTLDLKPGQTLELLVENTGRINYGHQLPDNRQGITGAVSLGADTIPGWEQYSLPMKDLTTLPFTSTDTKDPAFHQAHFTLDHPADTFLDLRGWGKGQVWINNHNLGRFWSIGPQQTLYVPAPYLKTGDNTVTVLELQDTGKRTLAAVREPVLDDVR
jgi:beta-galactosidase